jgi:hypothetical protein
LLGASGTLPANARQVYYAARPFILRLTGRRELSANYFTQTVFPDYVDARPNEAGVWDVVYDDRGHFEEPHTGRRVGLGTISVRKYLGQRVLLPSPATLDPGSRVDTVGPENRFRDVLFIEKEGLDSLIVHSRICQRFDIAKTSSKGMSVTALRMLLDGLVKQGMRRVFVLHDFDAYGFSIFGTLGTDSRRYTFKNDIEVVDLGLRLSDVTYLQDEAYEPSQWESRRETLMRHGATYEEISFLAHRRVELNAMPSDVFIEFLERKLTEHSVRKVVPSADVLEKHARQILERALTNKGIDEIRVKACADAAQVPLPDDLPKQVADALKRNPELPWDLAVAQIAMGALR